MANYPLKKLENNELLKYFLQKPKFLSSKDEVILLNLIKSNKLLEFYSYASKLIKSTRDVANLYIYLISRLESQNIYNEEIKNHICWRLFNMSQLGWLDVHDPEIIAYCKKNTTDKDLLAELKSIKSVQWFNEYLKFIDLEKQISDNFDNIEKNIEYYFKFIKKLLKSKKISQQQFDEALGNLGEQSSIYKGKQVIGSLISKELQAKLGFKMLTPKLSVKKSDSALLIGLSK